MKMNKEVVMVKLTDIIPNRFQPRLTFDEEALNELANSIREHGIIQPLILRDLGSKYEIIAGERRYKAATLAGLTEVPAIIGAMDDQTSAELALIENIQRKDLSAIEEAKSYKKILDMGNFTQEELAKRMGKAQSTIANKMRLLSLTNEVQVALMNNLISERHARCLLQIKDEDKQKEVLNKIISERMNVRDTDTYIKNLLGISNDIPKESEQESISPKPIPYELPQENPPVSPVNPEISIKEENKPINENPNVYKDTNNIDFVNISSLNEEDNIKSTLNNLNVVDTSREVFNDNEPKIEELTPSNTIEEPKEDNMSKVKLATAIRLAKDTVEDIKTVGYKVTMEEIDNKENYEIIIRVEK